MRVRLRKPSYGLQVGTIVQVAYLSFLDKGIPEDDVEFEWYENGKIRSVIYEDNDEFLETWELLQPVSSTTKQAIRESIVPILNYPLTTTDDMFEKIFGEVVDKAVTAVVSVLEGKE